MPVLAAQSIAPAPPPSRIPAGPGQGSAAGTADHRAGDIADRSSGMAPAGSDASSGTQAPAGAGLPSAAGLDAGAIVPSSAGASPQADDADAEPPAVQSTTSLKSARTRKGPDDTAPARASNAPGPAAADDFASRPDRQAIAPVIDQPGPAPDAARPLETARTAAAPTPAGDAAPLASAPAQPGHALAAIHTGPDGTAQIRILLNPAELGSVQVRILRTHDGLSMVSVAVERPETLRSLQTDLGHLHQALDRAGLPEQRTVTLHMAGPETAGGGPNDANAFGRQGAGQSGSEQNSPGRQHAPGSGPGTGAGSDAGPPWAETPHIAPAWHRAGVNITA